MAGVVDTVPVMEWLFRIRDYAVHSRFISEDCFLHLIDGLEGALSEAYPDDGFAVGGPADCRDLDVSGEHEDEDPAMADVSADPKEFASEGPCE